MAKTIFFSVGEPSGDLHGANLIRTLAAGSGEPIRAVGFGGPRMAAEGAELLFDLTQLAVMGFIEVFWKLPQFLRLAAQADRYFAEHRPDAVVLIDFPGFNWHIAKAAKKHGVPVFYYGTPQVWGWAAWRVKKLRSYVDHALCKLPFEEAWLRERGVNATFVGHPYFDELHTRKLDNEFVAAHADPKRPLVTLLPGSRTQEVRANFRWQLAAMKKIRQRVPSARFAVAAFKEKHVAMAEAAIHEAGFVKGEAPAIHVGRTPELIEAATCCLAVSGSVSLELLHHTKPTVILYHVSPFAYWLQSVFRRVPYITLVNLLTAPELFPEKVGVYDRHAARDAHVLMPEYLTCVDRSDELAEHAIEWLTNRAKRTEVVTRMAELKAQVDVAGASERAAEYVRRELGVDAATPRSQAA
ncbi:Glycosyl transferase [Botrimarina colliarenosi]|uniref:Lipid-A-disaccharide synthase n=1 Tax=Botrimarina colliarenosi TaxID=2528001 RepID=A0A5C6AIW3_9BACT|nr:lipid-A-disaccharide synthase [Botrimarina colliarenosi]TWT99559.1 Glycosyl transferase [Botrimarina colliarenosi]